MCYYGAKKMPDMMSGLMDLGKTEFLNQLTPDHDQEQIDRFDSFYDAVFTEEMERLGFIQWATAYEGVMNELTELAADGSITVKESETWCDDAEEILDAQGYWADE
jgi:hypothetical protein